MKHKHSIQKLSPKDKDFPDKLRQIPDPPKELYIIGDPSVLNQTAPSLAVVGSRKLTHYGHWAAKTLTEKVAEQGITIVSGLAYGVDSIAHKAALDSGAKTIAVLACGLDTIYPVSHTKLAKTIVEQGGALISEYPKGEPPLRHNFIARNRLISGLANATLIIEASSKSGTLHTANFALEQGRTVMAVPGNINSPNSEGTNRLIQTGATPVTKPEDILRELGIEADLTQKQLFGATKEESTILELLKSGISDASELLDQSGLDTKTFNQTLTMLEISGKIHPLGASRWGL